MGVGSLQSWGPLSRLCKSVAFALSARPDQRGQQLERGDRCDVGDVKDQEQPARTNGTVCVLRIPTLKAGFP